MSVGLPPAAWDLDDVVRRLQAGEKAVALVGAGLSVNCGISDYRSKGGMYDTLDPSALTASEEIKGMLREDPTYVVNVDCFETSPEPFMEVKRNFVLSLHDKVWKPSIGHHVLALLHAKGMLELVVTQNIDGLEAAAGVPQDALVQVHGTVATVRCHSCGQAADSHAYAEHLRHNVRDITKESGSSAAAETTVPHCTLCGEGVLRPDVVMFGESLHDAELEAARGAVERCSVLFVLGTSLKVAPVNTLPSLVPEHGLRVAIDKHPIGDDVGLRYGRGRDLLIQTDIDTGLLHLAKALGFDDELAHIARQDPPLMAPKAREMLSAPPQPLSIYAPEATDSTPCGVRCDLLVQSADDLQRAVHHSREARILVPHLGLELTSYITAGRAMPLSEFLRSHAEEVRRNMQMVMGGGSRQAVDKFVQDLEGLSDAPGTAWVLSIDDPTGDATIRGIPSDTNATLRTLRYVLTPAEKRKLGV